MHVRNLYRLLLSAAPLALFIVYILSGCVAKSPSVASGEETRTDSVRPMSFPGYNHFVNANLLELFGLYREAEREYRDALRYFPESATIRTDFARLLFRLQEIPEALEQARQIEPKNSDAHLLIGDCYRLLEKPDSAMLYYGRTVTLDPDNVNAYWYLAGYYRQAGMTDSAIAVYYDLARLSDTYRLWQELGTMLGQDQKYIKALEAFQKSIALQPDKTNILSYLGLAASYDALDSLNWAEETYARAIALDPYDVRIFRQMLAMYINRQDAKRAITASERVVALMPTDWVAQRRLGVLLYGDGQLDRADTVFLRQIAAGDDNLLNFFYRGRIAFEQKTYDSAIALFKETVERDSAFVDGWLNLGLAYRELDSLDRSVEMMRQGLAYCADNEGKTRVLFALGAALERGGRFYDAVTVFQELLSLDSGHAPALNYLGYMLADRGERLDYALKLIEKAVAISPENGAFIDSYGWVQFKLGNYELALTQLKKAAEIISNDAIIFEHIGDVHRAMGNAAEALQFYRRALEISPGSLSLEEKLKE